MNNEDMTIKESVQNYIDELKLPNDFYQLLLSEDDWSFVIKLSALLEAVCTNILTTKFNNNNIDESISFLEYANPRCGKINFLEKLNIIEKNQANTLYKLAQLRNKIVHNVASINFTFESYINDLDKHQKKSLVEWVGFGINDELKFKNITITKYNFCIDNTKYAIWITILEIIACIYLEKEVAEFKNTLNKNIETFLINQTLIDSTKES